ncbi:MAG: hypothetical protein GJ671_01220 [Alteromonadaceae bacterium]|nr:hypothetical protein [Alteromonadaceae bacterium]
MNRKVVWGLIGTLFFVVCLLTTLPAKQLVYRVNLPANIQLFGVSGSIWQGKIQRASVAHTELTSVRWSLSPWRLLTGKVGLELHVGNIRETNQVYLKGNAVMSLFKQHLALSDMTIRMPAQTILNRANLPMKVLAKGPVEVKLVDASVQMNATQVLCEAISGTGQWRNAQVLAPSGLVEMGTFDATLGCSDQNLTIDVAEPNALNLSFVASGRDLQSLRVNGRFNIPEDMPNEIKAVGRFLGQPGNDGYTQFTW